MSSLSRFGVACIHDGRCMKKTGRLSGNNGCKCTLGAMVSTKLRNISLFLC